MINLEYDKYRAVHRSLDVIDSYKLLSIIKVTGKPNIPRLVDSYSLKAKLEFIKYFEFSQKGIQSSMHIVFFKDFTTNADETDMSIVSDKAFFLFLMNWYVRCSF